MTDTEITLPTGQELTRVERIGIHSHIRGLGLNDNYEAQENADGMVGQLKARKAGGKLYRPVVEKKITARPVLIAGQPRTGKRTIAAVNKPKPLQASTNTINSQAKLNSRNGVKNQSENDQIIKKRNPTAQTEKKTAPKVDENYVGPFITNSYDPLSDICPLDDELYQKVLKLELADDGLPAFTSDEPFEF